MFNFIAKAKAKKQIQKLQTGIDKLKQMRSEYSIESEMYHKIEILVLIAETEIIALKVRYHI